MQYQKLAKVVNETVKRGGRIIIPAFAIERTQEIVYYLHMLTEKNLIPPLPIYVDSPMATSATNIFQLHAECYDEAITEDIYVPSQEPVWIRFPAFHKQRG